MSVVIPFPVVREPVALRLVEPLGWWTMLSRRAQKVVTSIAAVGLILLPALALVSDEGTVPKGPAAASVVDVPQPPPDLPHVNMPMGDAWREWDAAQRAQYLPR